MTKRLRDERLPQWSGVLIVGAILAVESLVRVWPAMHAPVPPPMPVAQLLATVDPPRFIVQSLSAEPSPPSIVRLRAFAVRPAAAPAPEVIPGPAAILGSGDGLAPSADLTQPADLRDETIGESPVEQLLPARALIVSEMAVPILFVDEEVGETAGTSRSLLDAPLVSVSRVFGVAGRGIAFGLKATGAATGAAVRLVF